MFRYLAVVVFLSASVVAQTAGAAPTPQADQAQQSSSPAATSPQIDPAKETAIRHLMQVMGGDGFIGQIMENMTGNIRPVLTKMLPPGDYRDQLIDLFIAKIKTKADPHKFGELLIPLYDKYYTADEIKGLAEFYQTPLGKKVLQATPKLTAESADLGRKWGESLGEESMKEVIAEHPELEKAMEEAAKAAQPK